MRREVKDVEEVKEAEDRNYCPLQFLTKL